MIGTNDHHTATPCIRGGTTLFRYSWRGRCKNITPITQLPIYYFFCLLLFLFLTGCTSHESSPDTQTTAKPLEGIKLQLLVVDDPAMAEAIGQLRGEWNAQTGAELQVEQASQKDLEGAESMSADAVIGPSHLLGPFAERDLLAPMPKKLLEATDWTDLFDLVKLREATWGKEVFAVPFGSPVLVCYYRADLLDKLGRRPPQTWVEYQELAKMLASQKPSGDAPWCGTIEPLAPGWQAWFCLPGRHLMQKHRDNYSTLFNIDTMEPLLTTPAITQALEELVATTKLGRPTRSLLIQPPPGQRFWKGQCGMTLTWPTAAGEGDTGKAESGEQKVQHDAAIPAES